MTIQHDPTDFYHKIYWESNAEFEEIRELCLSEDNWLRPNYLPSNLKIEEFNGYGVIFCKHTHDPVGMGGLYNNGNWPANVGYHMRREYLFPRWRQTSLTSFISGLGVYKKHLFEPLNAVNNFDIYFMTMQSRFKKNSNGYWTAFSTAIQSVMPEWKNTDGYIQTCQWPVKKCWQRFLICESVPGAWENWNPRILTELEWDLLPLGD
jgi:hypothetical protein